MIAELGLCSIGQLTNTECHKLRYTSSTAILNATDLSDIDRELISLRSDVPLQSLKTLSSSQTFFHEKI